MAYNYTTRRRTRRFNVGTPDHFIPNLWIDGDSMYADCSAFEWQKFTEKQEHEWMKLLCIKLREEWDVDARNLTIDWEQNNNRYRINFNDDQEFIMFKLSLR